MPQARTAVARFISTPAGWLTLWTLAATFLRGAWLAWQPLWWDEGYSFYFATEPITRMLALTAQDIHPPLYYLLLHGWLAGGIDPVRGRLFSVVVGALTLPLLVALTGELYPSRRRLQSIAAILLLVNPLHLYYSQEVRMYGLALLLGIASTLFLVSAVKKIESGEPARRSLAFYALFATLSLYTLYYLAFLLLAQTIWALWRLRATWKAILQLLATWLVVTLAYLPWLIYAGPKLTAYIKHKVASDKDQPLTIGEFLLRHLSAFISGHSAENSPLLRPESWIALGILLLIAITSIRNFSTSKTKATSASSHLLWLSLLIPALCAFLVNQYSPFFPVNGERLLLFTLPYFLLLLAVALDTSFQYMSGRIALAGLLALALVGIVRFYTLPRYTADDYRPLIRQIVEQSTEKDTFLATFPWQVGFWRAYVQEDSANSAQPRLLSDVSVEWDDKVAAIIDQSLQAGVIWFPSLLSIGSTLPSEVNDYLTQQGAFNVEDRWLSETTRLDAWRKNENIPIQDTSIDFGGLQINGVGIAPQQVSSANQPVDIRLRWTVVDPNRPLNLSLRLLDSTGRSWMQRDYRLASHALADGKNFVENIGLIVPPGLPPDSYQLGLHASFVDTEESLTIKGRVGEGATFAPLGTLHITSPQISPSPAKLPLQHALDVPKVLQDVTLLGYSGADRELLAGDQLEIRLFYQKLAEPLTKANTVSNLFVSLLDKAGNGVAGWEGWPLPGYTMDLWQPGALVQVPVVFDLPASVQTGKYRLITGLIDNSNGEKSTLIELGSVAVRQRKANFEALSPSHALDPQPLLGSHAALLGYDIERNDRGVLVRLYWRVEQTLLPPHHIFVHFDSADGATLAQVDGAPMTAEGIAPTGSWQAGEMLVTIHQLTGTVPDYDVIRVGLYNPESDQRLPVSVGATMIGDAVELR